MIHRITQRSSFDLLRRNGVVIRKGRVWIRFAPCDALVEPQVAYALGRKNGSAAHRNRIRRQFRERVRMFDSESGLPPGLYLIGLNGTEAPSLSALSAALSAVAERSTLSSREYSA